MPNGIELESMEGILTYEEIMRVVRCAVSLGIHSFRITGGEPLVRLGFLNLLESMMAEEGVDSVTLTTNGILLKKYAAKLSELGVKRINVSLDTVVEEEFKEITGFDALNQVLGGIEEALKCNIAVKLNAVSGATKFPQQLVLYAQENNLPLRFIELMPIGYGSKSHFVSNEDVIKTLEENFGRSTPEIIRLGNGPAVYRRFEQLHTPLGFISAVHDKFCSTCNRVRLTATGYLKGCLCYDTGVDLREILRSSHDDIKLRQGLEEAIFAKPKAHCFENRDEITELHGMSMIGG